MEVAEAMTITDTQVSTPEAVHIDTDQTIIDDRPTREEVITLWRAELSWMQPEAEATYVTLIGIRDAGREDPAAYSRTLSPREMRTIHAQIEQLFPDDTIVAPDSPGGFFERHALDPQLGEHHIMHGKTEDAVCQVRVTIQIT